MKTEIIESNINIIISVFSESCQRNGFKMYYQIHIYKKRKCNVILSYIIICYKGASRICLFRNIDFLHAFFTSFPLFKHYTT